MAAVQLLSKIKVQWGRLASLVSWGHTLTSTHLDLGTWGPEGKAKFRGRKQRKMELEGNRED